jgi:prepilin-type N-terminal cleavage/methylation domain-containing protein
MRSAGKILPKHRSKLNRGFTIVEVMLVLAIAGLILLVVFLAVPQLQRSQRDNTRKSMALRLKSELESFASNNQGVYPFTNVSINPPPAASSNCKIPTSVQYDCYDWYSRYLKDKVKIDDPTTGADINIYYDNIIAQPTMTTWTPGNAYIIVGGQCSNGTVSGTAGGPTSRSYAIVMALELQNIWYCTDNN